MLNKVLIALAALALVVAVVCYSIQGVFTNSVSLNAFLKSAKTYDGLSMAIKEQIVSDLKTSNVAEPIQTATGIVITPALTESLLKPELVLLTDWLREPASGGLSLRIDLRQFKDILADRLIADQPTLSATQVRFATIAAVPDQVIIASGQKDSSSMTQLLEAIKTIYIRSQQILPVAVLTALAAIGLIVILNIGSLGRMLRRASWPFVYAGGLLVILGLVAPLIVQFLFQKTPPANTQAAQSYIAAGLVAAIAKLTLFWGYVGLASAFGGLLISSLLLRKAKKRKRRGH
ncbi:hypothetical protein HYX70_00445 [Candidatus Saccharibacteria bacterium]|nr:hypothetical protein [Candidatus Saccharibacteria bacterium]